MTYCYNFECRHCKKVIHPVTMPGFEDLDEYGICELPCTTLDEYGICIHVNKENEKK